MKRGEIIILVGVIALLVFPMIFAWAVDGPLSQSLEMFPGETKIINFSIQNFLPRDADRTLIVRGSIIDGADIARFVETNTDFLIPFETTITVSVEINIPENAEIGDELRVEILFDDLFSESLGFGGIKDRREILIQIIGPPDADSDGVEDSLDFCPNTELPESFELKPNHFGDVDGDGIFEKMSKKEIADSEFTLKDTFGCSCTQILEIKPGRNIGEKMNGCTKGTLISFIKHKF